MIVELPPIQPHKCFHQKSTSKIQPIFSVIDRLIRQLMYLLVECQISRRVQLRHEDHDHLLLRIDRERGVEEPAPVIGPHRSQFLEWPLHAIDAEAQSESDLWRDL